MLAVFTLPSALNLPLANPGQTLEYAPVPGNGNSQPGGNFAGLGLGQSGAAQGESGLPPDLLPPDIGQAPLSNKHCVGNPPRQTEDPLSPPCVAAYKGDNGGATYTGVTANEVTVLYYLIGGGTDYGTSAGTSPIPANQYVDIGTLPSSSYGIWPQMLYMASLDFNSRYQTYNRRVHIYAYFNNDNSVASPGDPVARRQDAAANWAKLHPFAVISYVQYNSEDYLSEMARHGVVALVGSKMENYGSIGAPASYFRSYSGLLWSFDPSIDYRAQEFSNLVCSEVANRTTAFSGNVTDLTKPRKLGLLISQLVNYPEQQALGEDIKSDLVSSCAPNLEVAYKYVGSSDQERAANAAATMATFKRDQVTTVIDAGQSANESRAASAIGYDPEWVIAGDGLADASLNGSLQDQTVFKNAWLMTTFVHRGPSPHDDLCVQSALEAAPQGSISDILQYYCPLYDSTRQLFTAIQVAGPKLTPAQVDQGFHAIPHVASSTNRVPACFYDTADYTCVKDAMLEYWDPSGTDPEYGGFGGGGIGNGANGCWRLVENGARHVGSWPSRELSMGRGSGDQCNGQF